MHENCSRPLLHFSQVLWIFNKKRNNQGKVMLPWSLGIEFPSWAPWTCQSPRLPQAETSSKSKALSGRVSFNNTFTNKRHKLPWNCQKRVKTKDLNKKVHFRFIPNNPNAHQKENGEILWNIVSDSGTSFYVDR